MKLQTKFKKTEIGMIPEDWEVKVILEVAEINKHTIGKEFKYEDIDYIDITSVDKGKILERKNLKLSKAPSRAKRIIKKDDIIISTVRPNLKHFAFIKKPKPNSVVSTGFAVITSKNIFPEFLYYYLTTDKYTNYLSAIADTHTSTYPAINPDVIEISKIPFPSLPEQCAIAKILSFLYSKIELNQQINKILESIGQAIFKRWFVDFEFPNEQGKPYKSSRGEMIDSELGKIPKGWEVKPIDEIADFLNGLVLQKFPAESEDEFLPVIKIKELKNGITEQTDKASKDIPKEYVVSNGDVLFSWSGSLENIIWCNGKGALNQHLFKVTSKKYPKWFYYYWINEFLPEYKQIAKGKATTMGHIQRHHLKGSLVLVPDIKTVKRMNYVLMPIINKIIESKIQSQNLSQICNSLLPKLMSGQIRVPVEVENA